MTTATHEHAVFLVQPAGRTKHKYSPLETKFWADAAEDCKGVEKTAVYIPEVSLWQVLILVSQGLLRSHH